MFVTLYFSAPIGVKPPYNVTVISGYIIQGSWQQPESTAGLLSMYALKAYNLDHPEIPPVEARFYNDTIFKGMFDTFCQLTFVCGL